MAVTRVAVVMTAADRRLEKALRDAAKIEARSTSQMAKLAIGEGLRVLGHYTAAHQELTHEHR